MEDRIMRAKEVARTLSVSVPTVWRLARSGELRKVKVSAGVTGWLESEVRRFLEAKSQKPGD